jgi:hypothetical protein
MTASRFLSAFRPMPRKAPKLVALDLADDDVQLVVVQRDAAVTACQYAVEVLKGPLTAADRLKAIKFIESAITLGTTPTKEPTNAKR